MKKLLSLLLVTVLTLGTSITALAAPTAKEAWDAFVKLQPKVTGFAGTLKDGVNLSKYNVDDLQVKPQKGVNETLEIKLPLKMFQFKGKDGKAIDLANFSGALENLDVETPITEKIWRDSKMNVRIAVSSGSKAIDSYKFDKGFIKIEFVDELVSTDALDFEFKVYLVIDGKRMNAEALEVSGTIENHVTKVYDDDDYVDLSDGAVAEAEDFIKGIEVDLGEGVSIHTKFFKGKKYYGTASTDVDASDDEILSKYPDIENVIILKTIGLNGTGNIVAFGSNFSAYYVYDKDLTYLGKADEMLPYSTKYYLSSKKLDIVAEEEPAEEGEEEELPPTTDTENPVSGGDDAPVNVNDNPGTGR